MLDKILNKLGLTRLENLEKMYDGIEEAAYDIRMTYDIMENMLNYDLPGEVKIMINKYLVDHEWIVRNVIIENLKNEIE